METVQAFNDASPSFSIHRARFQIRCFNTTSPNMPSADFSQMAEMMTRFPASFHSTQQEKKDQAIGDRFVSRFEEDIKKLANGLYKKRCLKKYDKVMVKIGRLRQKYSKVSSRYSITVERDEKNGNACKITWQQQPAPDTTDTYPGVYCLRTSQLDWNESTLCNTYTMLTDLEAVFRSLKSELGLRPIHHHQITKRISGHLFITVLAYHLVHTIRFRLKQKGINSSWSSIRKTLSPQKAG